MTAQNVIDDARRHLADSAGTRWTDATLLICLSNALFEVEDLRPDLTLVDGDSLVTVATVTAVGDTLPFGSETRGALAYLTAANALSEDSDDRTNMERADQYRNTAVKLLLKGQNG